MTKFGVPQSSSKQLRHHIVPTLFSSCAEPAHYTATMSTTTDDKILRTTKFPIEFNQKVDIQKVNADLMKKYAGPPFKLLEFR